MGFNFPYGNKQQLNLDWFLRKFKELVAAWNDKEESIDGALDAEIQKAEDALSDVYTARDVTVAAKNDALQAKADALTAAANAAQYWQNAAASANSAATSAVTALQAAQDAANDADQTSSDRAGVAADKAAVAADKATVASDKATVAADKATVAADKAIVAQDKDDVDTMKDAANAAALRSEGWADGTQNGAPVTSGSPYYENNAKYFKDEAQNIANSIPSDYSDLSNNVTNLDLSVKNINNELGVDFINVEGEGVMPSVGYQNVTLISGIKLRKNYYYYFNFTLDEAATAPIYFVLKTIDNEELTSGSIRAGETTATRTFLCNDDYQNTYIIVNANAVTAGRQVKCVFSVGNTIVSALAPIIPDMIADTALSQNDFRIVNNKLYKITSPIAAGSNLIPNTNCIQTTIAAQLKLLLT